MDDLALLAVVASSFFAVILLAHRLLTSYKANGLPLPPGPRTSRFGGAQLPQTYHWLTYARWKETFGLSDLSLPPDLHLSSDNIGDIIYIYTLGNPIVVLNTAEAANPLLD